MDEMEGGENLALWRLRWSRGGSSQITVRNNRKASKETRRTLHATEILSVARGQSGQCQIYWRRRNKSPAGANGMQQRTAASVFGGGGSGENGRSARFCGDRVLRHRWASARALVGDSTQRYVMQSTCHGGGGLWSPEVYISPLLIFLMTNCLRSHAGI
jgi:hypothetical protein